jgi:hypothetical protein
MSVFIGLIAFPLTPIADDAVGEQERGFGA